MGSGSGWLPGNFALLGSSHREIVNTPEQKSNHKLRTKPRILSQDMWQTSSSISRAGGPEKPPPPPPGVQTGAPLVHGARPWLGSTVRTPEVSVPIPPSIALSTELLKLFRTRPSSELNMSTLGSQTQPVCRAPAHPQGDPCLSPLTRSLLPSGVSFQRSQKGRSRRLICSFQ